MAGAFGRAFIAKSRAKYALHWPLYLRTEFITLWQELSARRMTVFGWDLEPSAGAPQSKRFWEKWRVSRRKRGIVGIWVPKWLPVRQLWLARMGVLPNTISLAINPPRMKMPYLAQWLPRPRPLLLPPAFVWYRPLVLFHRPLPPRLPPPGGIPVLRK